MKKRILALTVLLLSLAVTFMNGQKKGFYENVQKKNVSKVLDDLNQYAAAADFKNYLICLRKNRSL